MTDNHEHSYILMARRRYRDETAKEYIIEEYKCSDCGAVELIPLWSTFIDEERYD